MQTALTLIYGAVAGAAIGSFLGCAAYRLPRRIPLSGRSFCPACGKQLRARENLPVVGWLWLRGRAACCGSRLSVHYLLFEAGCAVAGAMLAYLTDWRVAAAVCFAVLIVTYLVFYAYGLPQITERKDESGSDALDDDPEAADAGRDPER